MDRPDILDAAVAEILKIPHAIGDTANGQMCLMAGSILYWRGRGVEVDPMRKAIAEELLGWLNDEAWLDGQWVVCWTKYDWIHGRYTQLSWCYLDKDNDLLFEVNTDEPAEIIMLTISDRVDHAFQAYLEYQSLQKDLGITDGERIKAALGQKSANYLAKPTFDLFGMD